MSDEDIYNPTSNITLLNYHRRKAEDEKNSHSPLSRYRASAQLDFEFQVLNHMSRTPKIYEWISSELQKLDHIYGSGRDPRHRSLPEYMKWKEAEERYSLCEKALHRSGLGSIEPKGGEKVPEIHMRDADPCQYIGQMIKERIDSIKNAVVLFVGDTGSAKSYSGIQLGRYIASIFGTPFSIENVALGDEEFFDRMAEDGNVVGRVTVADDMSQWANSRQYGGDINITLAKLFDTFRSRGEIIIITTPRETKIDKSIRENIHFYLVSPGKNSQGVFEPGDPTFDDKGKLESVNFYHFPGPENWDPIDLILDTVKFPFDGMHEMTEDEKKACEVPDNVLARMKGRDCNGVPWPNDPLLREYELKKKRIFGEAAKEGKLMILREKEKQKIEDQKRQEWMSTLELRRMQRETKQEELELKQAAIRKKKTQIDLPPVEDRIMQLREEGLSESDIADKLKLEGYKISQSTVHRKLSKKLIHMN